VVSNLPTGWTPGQDFLKNDPFKVLYGALCSFALLFSGYTLFYALILVSYSVVIMLSYPVIIHFFLFI
jgi:hypothetical protein